MIKLSRPQKGFKQSLFKMTPASTITRKRHRRLDCLKRDGASSIGNPASTSRCCDNSRELQRNRRSLVSTRRIPQASEYQCHGCFSRRPSCWSSDAEAEKWRQHCNDYEYERFCNEQGSLGAIPPGGVVNKNQGANTLAYNSSKTAVIQLAPLLLAE